MKFTKTLLLVAPVSFAFGLALQASAQSEGTHSSEGALVCAELAEENCGSGNVSDFTYVDRNIWRDTDNDEDCEWTCRNGGHDWKTFAVPDESDESQIRDQAENADKLERNPPQPEDAKNISRPQNLSFSESQVLDETDDSLYGRAKDCAVKAANECGGSGVKKVKLETEVTRFLFLTFREETCTWECNNGGTGSTVVF